MDFSFLPECLLFIDAAGWEAWSYDSRGHVIAERRNTNSVTKSTAYTYNFHGGVTSITYPSGRTVTYTYNAAGQTGSASDVANSITYAGNAHYNAAGALASLQESGSNIISTMYYNNRLQPCRISVKSSGTAPGSCTDSTNVGNVMDFTYGFNSGSADNGNVASITNNINTARTQSYTYDELNRVSTAQTTATSGTYSWGLAFTYDPWANLLSASVTQGSAYSFSVYADGANRIHNTGGTFTYDAAGNVTADPVNSSYNYSAEGELTSAAGITYTYDGDGNRVKKSSGKMYWYGLGGDPISESDSSGNLTAEFVFLSGQRIAMLTPSSGSATYYVTDHLGSSHIVTNSSGAILDDSDYYPFGGERSYSSSSGNNYKFTGKERDSESGLDDFVARFYTSNYGRFLSPDESKYAKPTDPQTWNLYGYVANNPINAVDPSGHAPESAMPHAPYLVEEHGGDPADFGGEGAGGGEGPPAPGDSNDETNSGSTLGFYQVNETLDGVIQPTEYEIATSPTAAIAAADFDRVWENYPTHAEFGSGEAGTSGKSIQQQTGVDVLDTCALRMSYALNKSGFTIGKDDGRSAMKGSNGQYYLVSVADVSSFITKSFGATPLHIGASDVGTFVQNNQTTSGFVAFSIHFKNSNASGHVALFSNGQFRDKNDNYTIPDPDKGYVVRDMNYWRMK